MVSFELSNFRNNKTKKMLVFERLLKEQVMKMISNIKILFPVSPEILIAEGIFSKVDNEVLIDHISKHLVPHEDRITKRDDEFFLENDYKEIDICKQEVKDKLKVFLSKLWRKMNTRDKENMWKYLDVFIRIVKNYEKEGQNNKH